MKRHYFAFEILFCAFLLFITPLSHPLSAKNEQPVTQAASASSRPFDDEFNSPALNPRWHWLNEDPNLWSLTTAPGYLQITGTNNDMWMACTNPKNLLLQQLPVANYEIQTKLFITATMNYQQGGLLIFTDLDNYIKLDVVWNDLQKGLSVEFIREENGVTSTWPWIKINSSNPAFLKIIKSGDAYSGFYSSDGNQWKAVGYWNTTTIIDPQVGIFSLANNCNGNTPGISVKFDFFRVSEQVSLFTGQGFDKCELPTLNELKTWMTASPYRAINLYLGGSRRSCANTGLTPSSVQEMSRQGWLFIPTWVGPQCLYGDISSDLLAAYNQGVYEAYLAMNTATSLGLTLPDSSGTIIYYDMEGYMSENPGCRDSAKSFIQGWTDQLHDHGNLSGVYGSSCAANISDFSEIDRMPDAVWPAGGGFFNSQYSSNATVWGISCIADSLWNDHQRIYQYNGTHQETWGGVTLSLDSDVIDGIVVKIPISYQFYLPAIIKR